MSDSSAKITPRSQPPKGVGAALLTSAGVAAAFGLASCCALPLLLTTLGLGTAWLSGVALLAEPNRMIFLGVGAVCLFGGAILLARQQLAATRCGPNSVCTPPAARAFTLAGLVLGVVLLWAGYTYA